MTHTAFSTFPVLSTERCILRKLDLEDAAEVFILRSSEQVNQFVDRPRATSVNDAIGHINKIHSLLQKNEAAHWAITLKQQQRFVGTIGIWNIDRENERAELGYELLPKYQGKGIMQEVLPVVINFGFNKMQLKIIEGCVQEGNIKSVTLLKKVGFEGDLEADEERKQPGMKEVFFSLSVEKWKTLALQKPHQ